MKEEMTVDDEDEEIEQGLKPFDERDQYLVNEGEDSHLKKQ
jgi:hypothetical protein